MTSPFRGAAAQDAAGAVRPGRRAPDALAAPAAPAPPPAPVVLSTRRPCPFDPPPELARLRDEAPVRPLRYPDGHVGWLVTGHEHVRKVLADPRFSARSEFKRVPVPRPGADPFIGRPALPGWFVDMDRPEHTRFRRLLAGSFSAHRTRLLRPRLERFADDLLEAMAASGRPEADLVGAYALPLPSLAICEFLGVPYADRAAFQRDSTLLFSLEATAGEAETAMDALTGLLRALVRHRRRHPGDDLLSRMVDGGLTDEEAAGAGVLLLTAGHETVAGMLGLGTFALLCRPEALAALRADLSPRAVETAVEELLRYLTIFQFGVPRTPLEDVELAGCLLRAGESVTCCLPAANRDPLRFPDPDRLDLTRPVGGHVAFGYGIHQCVGQNLARVELAVGYTALLRRFPGLRLAVPPGRVPLGTDMGFYCVHRLPVTW
ncbi:cytochrome P450 [Streptomyces leeuwenhoekii]|uniref:cytochrome P450 n=1 Tax=Streptomyces leeuwenhoekii TaxID=1437453 RepID=UPI0036C38DF0